MVLWALSETIPKNRITKKVIKVDLMNTGFISDKVSDN